MEGQTFNRLRTIVILDDDMPFVKDLKEGLESEGYAVYAGYDGSMAIELVLQHQPDLILMDVKMPYVNGIRAFENLRNNPKTAHIPVIFLSQMGSSMIYPVIESSPRAALLKKPFDLPDLSTLCRQFIRSYAA